MAGADLWRSLCLAAAVAPAADLFRGVRARVVPDHVRAAIVARGIFAADLRMERGGHRPGAGRAPRRRLGALALGADLHDLDPVRFGCPQGPDRSALPGPEGAGADRPPDLSRADPARLDPAEMADQGVQGARSSRRRTSRAGGADRLARADVLSFLLGRAGRGEGTADHATHGLPDPAEIFSDAGRGLERLGPQSLARALLFG